MSSTAMEDGTSSTAMEDGKLPISRHFFKVLMPGSPTKLSVPPAFCKRIAGSESEEAILTSCMGKWRVKIEKCNDKGLICFTTGWDDFARHHGLSIGDFAVFEHKGGMNFHVSVFDPSACEKEYSTDELVGERERAAGDQVNIRENAKPTNNTAEESPLEKTMNYSTKISHFTSTIDECHGNRKRPYMHIPMEFQMSNDLGRYDSLTLRDPKGKLWPVVLRTREVYSGKRKRSVMTKGWHEFYTSNKLKKGDVCTFELNQTTKRSNSVVMDVRISPKPT